MSELFAKPYKLAEVATALLDDFTADAGAVIAAINGIEQTELKTDLMAVFDTVVPDLLAYNADRRILLILSDGEHTIDSEKQAILEAAATFKQAGGVIIVLGIRASGVGYDFLERVATGGYFINATPSNAESAINGLNYLKSLLCAGECAVAGNVFQSLPQRNYHDFINFEVVSGKVNLLGPGLLDLLPDNGMYVELAEAGEKGLIRTSNPIDLTAGRTYRINFQAAGNQRAAIAGQGIKVFVREVDADSADPNIFEQTVFPDWDDDFQNFSFNFIPISDVTVRLNFEQVGTDAEPLYGNLLDDVVFYEASTLTEILNDTFDGENAVFIPPSCGPSAATAGIDNAPEPSEDIAAEDMLIPYPGGSVWNGEDYLYGVSWVTAHGETAVVNTKLVPTAIEADSAVRVTLPTEPAGVISVRLWRNINSGPTLHLLATLAPGQPFYDDWESNAEFLARYDESLTAPTENTTATASGELGVGYDCDVYECTSEPPGAQSPDSSPLPDIESGYTPPQQYTSTKTVCAECDGDQENLSLTPLAWSYVSSSNSPKESVTRLNAGAAKIKRLCFGPGTIGGRVYNGMKFYGSNDGVSWTLLFAAPSSVLLVYGVTNCYKIESDTAYLYHKVAVDSVSPDTLNPPFVLLGANSLYGAAPTQVCKTATRTSYVSQSDADNLATEAARSEAEAELNCGQIFTATESFPAVCPFNQYGQSVTKSATRTSYVSQSDAQDQALAAAQAEAEAELDCTGSNNNVRTVINDNTKATPYPSVKHVSGLTGLVTKVTVALNGLTHPSPDDIKILLIAPDGTTNCLLMNNCGGVPLDGGSISNVNLVLDQAAASPLPDGVLIASGTYRPAQYGASGGPGLLPLPVPSSIVTYGTSLNEFNGIDPNGSWSLWIFDDLSIFDGSLNSWDLTITTA
jgi:subtilisin-like proprotein convertase family protein